MNLILSAICLLIVALLIVLFHLKKIDIIQLIVYSFSLQYFRLEIVGPSLTVFVLISFYLMLFVILNHLLNNKTIPLKQLFILSIPLFSVVIVWALFLVLDYKIFNFRNSNYWSFLMRPFYHYIKIYLPLFSLIYGVYINRSNVGLARFLNVTNQVLTLSIALSVFQLLVHATINNSNLDSIFGAQEMYYYEVAGIPMVRIQGFFREPKHFSSVLGFMIPLVYKNQKHRGLLYFGFGVLTISHSFYVILIICTIAILIWRYFKSIRLTLIMSLICFFTITSISYGLLINNLEYQEKQSKTVVEKLVLDRVLKRFDYADKDNILLGLPLQSDLEVPLIKFFKEYPLALLTGFGPSNSMFLPYAFWSEAGLSNYLDIKYDRTSIHLNMRWFYYASQYGIVLFGLILLELSRHGKYRVGNLLMTLSLLACFFNEMDAFALIVYGLNYGQH